LAASAEQLNAPQFSARGVRLKADIAHNVRWH